MFDVDKKDKIDKRYLEIANKQLLLTALLSWNLSPKSRSISALHNAMTSGEEEGAKEKIYKIIVG